MRDMWGLDVGVGPVGLSAWNRATSALVSLTGDLVPAFDDLIESGEALAVSHALRAAAATALGIPWSGAREASSARSEIANASGERERSAVAGLLFLAERRTAEATDHLIGHIGAFRGDPVVAQLAFSLLMVTALPADEQRANALVEHRAGRSGEGQWVWQDLLAYVLAERGEYDRAYAVALSVLAEQPRAVHSAHALAHCFFRTGEHAAGLQFLEEWTSQGSPAVYGPHLSWHAALHELALGNLEGVRRRCAHQIPVSDIRNVPSLLWRLRLAECPFDVDRAQHVGALARLLIGRLPSVFTGFNVALALSLVDDVAGLASLARASARDPRPGFSLLPGLARALASKVQGEENVAADLFAALLPRTRALGGSSIQREIVEDILLHTLVAAGRGDSARAILAGRLERRPAGFYEQRLAGAVRYA